MATATERAPVTHPSQGSDDNHHHHHNSNTNSAGYRTVPILTRTSYMSASMSSSPQSTSMGISPPSPSRSAAATPPLSRGRSLDRDASLHASSAAPRDANTNASAPMTVHDASPLGQYGDNSRRSSNGQGAPSSRTTNPPAPSRSSATQQPTTTTSNDSAPAPVPSAAESLIMPAPAAAAAAVHQPKIVQTAFIHKLYNMLEDQSIKHLITWSSTSDSFVMQPSPEFSKALAQYFKHTNISSFVRQLNMYGFHKISDVLNQGNPDSAMWEFKHGNNNFRRGDVDSLREIKRRPSRPVPAPRDQHMSRLAPPPGTPPECLNLIADSNDPRLASIEHHLFDCIARQQRMEEIVLSRQRILIDALSRSLRYSSELSRAVLAMVPSPDNPIHRDVLAMQSDIQRQTEILRSIDDTPHDQSYPPVVRPFYVGNETSPASPRHMPQDDMRRPDLGGPRASLSQNRPAVFSGLAAIPARRPYGSIGDPTTTTTQSTPSSLRQQVVPPPPPGSHPLAHVESLPGSLARRHTSADIREHDWQARPPPLPPSMSTSSARPGQRPPSPSRAPEDARLSDKFAHYHFSNANATPSQSRPVTPSPLFGSNTNTNTPSDAFGGWSWNAASRDNRNLIVKNDSIPPTRRGSVAHLLNPPDSSDHNDDVDPRGDEDRKRQRIQ